MMVGKNSVTQKITDIHVKLVLDKWLKKSTWSSFVYRAPSLSTHTHTEVHTLTTYTQCNKSPPPTTHIVQGNTLLECDSFHACSNLWRSSEVNSFLLWLGKAQSKMLLSHIQVHFSRYMPRDITMHRKSLTPPKSE